MTRLPRQFDPLPPAAPGKRGRVLARVLRRSRSALVLAACAGVWAACSPVPDDPLTVPPSGEAASRGRVLVRGLAACGSCHGERRSPESVLQGGLWQRDRYGRAFAPNITPDPATGVGEWSAADLVHLFRTSERRDGSVISGDAHRGLEWASDSDLFAIIAYLRSVPPVPNEVPRRDLGPFDRNVTGFFDVPRRVTGHVPELDRRFRAANGEYLVDHVARCSSCHDGQATLLGSGGYLEGGRPVENEKGVKVAPRIRGGRGGAGAWGAEEFAAYLRTGVTPDGTAVDPDFCPVRFYAEADPGQIGDVAYYLGGGADGR